jgi:hypothetical protein
MEAHDCNPSYLGGGGRRILSNLSLKIKNNNEKTADRAPW